jgi:hypothetical protein
VYCLRLMRCIIPVVLLLMASLLAASTLAIEPPRCAFLFAGKGVSGLQNGTATFIEHEGELYIVTAYHNLFEKSTAELTIIKRNGVSGKQLELGKSEFLESGFYYDTVNDLAVLKIKPQMRDAFRATYGADVQPVELYTNATVPITDPPQGAQGISIGNPRVGEKGGVEFSPQNIVYSCTISEYEVAVNRIGPAVKSNTPESEAAANNRWLFVEAMSIAEGFSGGPIIVSELTELNGNVVHSFRLAGIVAGGSSLLRPGRFAWASRASTVREAITAFRLPVPPPANSLPRTGMLKFPPAAWPNLPYNTRHAFSFDHQRFFKQQTFRASIRQDREVLANAAAYELIFDKCVFMDDVFRGTDQIPGAYLANATFTQCRFDRVKFDRAILSGAIFHNCEPSPDLKGLLDAALSHGSALLKGPELVERPPLEEEPVKADEKYFQEFLKLSSARAVEKSSAKSPSTSPTRPIPTPMRAPPTIPPVPAPALHGNSYRELMDREKEEYRAILKGPVPGN